MHIPKPSNSFIITQYHVSVDLPSHNSSQLSLTFASVIMRLQSSHIPTKQASQVCLISLLVKIQNLEQLLKLLCSKKHKLMLFSKLRR